MKLEKQIQLLEQITGKKVMLEDAHECHCGGSCCTDKKSLKENYMGNAGEEYFIDGGKTSTYSSMPPSFYLIQKDTSDMIDMTFSSPEEATKYATGKGLVIVPKPIDN